MNDVISNDASVQSEWSADELIPFGKYILLDRISSGGTAAVYRANVRGEAGFERLVAIKRILPHMAGDRDFVDTFVREAKTVARLAHTGICPIYELGKVGESLYMAVEYIQGRDLGLIMRRLARRGETMAPLISAWIAARLCDALDYAHSLKNQKGVRTGMIHRDLSPNNILVSYEGQVKLIDFGLARAVGRAQSTNVDALKKKLSYMSPEMVKGRQLDARSDIFGVGICLYEMVTGRRLFAANNDIETLKLVGKASVPPPSAVVDDTPDELEIVIMHSLEREPEDRFQSAAEMGEALNAFIQKTDPTFTTQRLADWMRELFEQDIQEEQQRIKILLAASSDPELIKQRRIFFASPSGAAARARAEIERRLSTEPPPAHIAMRSPVPQAAKVPTDAAPPTGTFDEEPTGFYDAEKTLAAPPDFAARVLEQERSVSSGVEAPAATAVAHAESGGFDDEPTHFVLDKDVKEASAPESQRGTGGFDEEPTEIFFNKEDGIGIQALMDEYNEMEAPAPLNKPIIAPELGLPPMSERAPISIRPRAPSPLPVMRAPSSLRAPTLEIELRKRPSTWPIALGALVLVAAIFALIARTPVGVALGLRAPTTGRIEVRTSPSTSAEVQLDEVFRGHTPLRLQGVHAGMHRLAIRAAGYLPVTREVQVQGGATALLDVTLVEDQPKPEPPAAVPPKPVAEEHAGKQATERGRPSISGRPHRAASRQASDVTAEAAPPQAAATPAPATPMTPGSLAINTVPWSLVFIDGRDTGRSTPLMGYPIAPGPHEIGLQTATGELHVERIEVLPGQTVRITRRF